MNLLLSFIVRLLGWYFRKVPFPASIEHALAKPESPILVAPNDALVWQGLVRSIAHAVGLPKVVRITGTSPASDVSPSNTGTLRWLSLHDNDALRLVLTDASTPSLATLNVFQLRGPVKALPQHRPGIGWNIGMLLTRRLMTVLIGTEISVADARRHGGDERGVARLRRLLKLDFNRNLKVVRGVPVQSLSEQARSILSGADFERELRILAERAGETQSRMRRQAEKSFYEIAANQRRTMYSVLAFVARLILNRLFTSVHVHGIDALRDAIKGHAVVLVPMHRSHLDYILLQYKLYEAAVNPPHVAAGHNLNFWPVGSITRSAGAYFVKRNARDRLHMLILRRYVTYLMQRGHSQMFFIEGGRSRSGKMMRPKTGLLGVLFDAYRKGLRKEILFVPTAISYEQVIEDQEFGSENTGRSKTKENLVSTFHALDIFKKKYGEVLITFGEPLSLSHFMRQRAQIRETQGNTPAPSTKSDDREALHDFGLLLVRNIRRHVSPSLTNLAYTALMTAPQYGLSRPVLAEAIRNLAFLCNILQREFGAVGENTPSLERFLEGREAILNDLTREGIVERAHCIDEEIFFIPGKRRYTADFYRNGVIHLFAPLSMLAILELLGEPLHGTSLRRFHGSFQSDLLLPEVDSFVNEAELLITILIKHGIMQEQNGQRSFVSRTPGLFIPALLEAPLETILWVWNNLIRTTDTVLSEPSSTGESTRAFSYARFLGTLQAEFRVARYAGLVHRTEAASLSMLTAVLDMLAERKIIDIEDKGSAKHRIILPHDLSEEVRAEFEFLARAHRAIRDWKTPKARDDRAIAAELIN